MCWRCAAIPTCRGCRSTVSRRWGVPSLTYLSLAALRPIMTAALQSGSIQSQVMSCSWQRGHWSMSHPG